MSDTLGTNTSGFDYPNATYRRKLVPLSWDKKVIAQVNDKLLLKAFTGGEGSGLPFILKSDLEKSKGDVIRMAMSAKMDGLGKWNNATLEDSEEPIEMSYVDVKIGQVRNAFKDDGAMSRQRDTYNLKSIASNALSDWMADTRERYLLNTIYYAWPPHILGDNTTLKGYNENSGVVEPCRWWYCADSANNVITYSGTDATYIASIKAAEALLSDTESDYFGPDILEGVRAKLVTGNFKPIRYKGWTGYLGIIHPYQTAQLRKNQSWFDANIQAMPAGADNNPIFSGGLANGAVGKWNNILLFESNLVHSGDTSYYTDKISTAGGSNTVEIDSNCASVYRAIFLGAEAVAIANGEPIKFIQKGDFDYNDKQGLAISAIFGSRRCEFTEDTSTATLTNQSSMIVSTYSPATAI